MTCPFGRSPALLRSLNCDSEYGERIPQLAGTEGSDADCVMYCTLNMGVIFSER